MESVGLQYGSDEFVERPVNDGRYASPKSGALYAPDNFYDAASGSWYSASGGGSGPYGPQSTSSSYHSVNHPSMSQQTASHEHYNMSPHMEAPHMSTTPQPLPPMSSFRGGSTNGPPATSVQAPSNPALYNSALTHHAPSHSLQNDTLVGKALQTVRLSLTQSFDFTIFTNKPCIFNSFRCIQMIKVSAVIVPIHQHPSIHHHR